MEKDRKRARRRADLERMKRRAVRLYGRYELINPRYWADGVEPDVRRHEKLANHMAACSGPCCGNPRRWFGEKTMQERRAEHHDPLPEDR